MNALESQDLQIAVLEEAISNVYRQMETLSDEQKRNANIAIETINGLMRKDGVSTSLILSIFVFKGEIELQKHLRKKLEGN